MRNLRWNSYWVQFAFTLSARIHPARFKIALKPKYSSLKSNSFFGWPVVLFLLRPLANLARRILSSIAWIRWRSRTSDLYSSILSATFALNRKVAYSCSCLHIRLVAAISTCGKFHTTPNFFTKQWSGDIREQHTSPRACVQCAARRAVWRGTGVWISLRAPNYNDSRPTSTMICVLCMA